jgi:hypothetical protein
VARKSYQPAINQDREVAAIAFRLEDVECRAYEIYLERDELGRDLDDCFRQSENYRTQEPRVPGLMPFNEALAVRLGY